MYLLDTCIVSELSPERSSRNAHVADWLQQNGELCYLSVVTLTEITCGIAWLRRRRATAKAARLARWQEELLHFHKRRIITVDAEIAIRAGALLSIARAAGSEPSIEDAWIAATAERHGFELLTFNDADFKAMRVAFRNPRTAPPPS